MNFSVIIPAHNEAKQLPRTLLSIHRAAARRTIEVIVVDDCSTDDTPSLAAQHGARVISPTQRNTIAELRNIGARTAKREYLMFLDADMEVPAEWFDRAEKQFSCNDVDAFGFVENIPDEAPWYAKIWSRRSLARRPDKRKVDFLPGRNICIRKKFFDRVGGFSSTMMTSEDKDFVMRVANEGGGVYSVPPIGLVHWGYEKSFSEWCRKEFWRQHSHLAMIRSHGPSMRVLRFPLISITHFVFGICVLFLGVFWRATWLIALPVLLAPGLALALSKEESRKSLGDVISFTFLYAARFVIAGAAFISEAFRYFTAARRDIS